MVGQFVHMIFDYGESGPCNMIVARSEQALKDEMSAQWTMFFRNEDDYKAAMVRLDEVLASKPDIGPPNKSEWSEESGYSLTSGWGGPTYRKEFLE